MGVRQELLTALKPILPKRWNVIPYADNVDELSRTIVMFRVEQIERTTAAPSGSWTQTILMTVAVPALGSEKAQDDLDEEVSELLLAIDKLGGYVGWKTAKHTLFANRYHAYDVPLTILTKPKE